MPRTSGTGTTAARGGGSVATDTSDRLLTQQACKVRGHPGPVKSLKTDPGRRWYGILSTSGRDRPKLKKFKLIPLVCRLIS